ncbi:MAG TPA: hypothetical protein VGE74_31055 [Gemmata sp.]
MSTTNAAELVACEVWVMVREDGSYEVSTDPADMQAPEGEACRMVKVMVNVPKPRPAVLTATVAEEPEVPPLKVA